MDIDKRKEKERRQKGHGGEEQRRRLWRWVSKNFHQTNILSFCPLLESLICNDFSPIVVNWLWFSFPSESVSSAVLPKNVFPRPRI